MSKKLLAILCALALVLSLGTGAFASSEASGEASADASGEASGDSYVSEYLPGASAVYAAGVEKTFDNAYFYGAGYSTAQEITAEVSSQYGHGAVILAVGEGTSVTLNNPTVEADPESRANGVFASAMAKATVNGGSITTNNTGGHGLDVTYMGHIYAYDTVIYTNGTAAGAVASDYGGGFVYGERLDCTTDGMMSPGIFCAGSSIFMLKDSSFTVNNGNGVVLGMYNSVVMLENCRIKSSKACIDGLLSSGSTVGDKAYVFGGTLESTTGAVISEGGGCSEVNLVGVELIPGGADVVSVTSGTLVLNIWDTELCGNVNCTGGSLTVNLYAGAKITGEILGSAVVNDYSDGSGEPAPEPKSFDEYLMDGWAISGSLRWDEETVENYVTNVEPEILENSFAVFTVEGASAKLYDPETYDPSENGVDITKLPVGEPSGEASGEPS